MSQTMWSAVAVAATDRPGTDAAADVGPHVAGVTAVHNHTGTPTSPVEVGGGAMPISGPNRWSRPIASCASWAAVTVGPKPGGGVADHPQPPPVPMIPGQTMS